MAESLAVDIAVVGGGPAGLSVAHAVLRARPGTRVAVLERSDLRPRGAVVALPPNGVRAVAAIAPELLAALQKHHTTHLIQRRYRPNGEVVVSSDSGDVAARVLEHGPMLTLPWHALQRELAEALPPGVLHTQHRFLSYEEGPDGTVTALFATPQGQRAIKTQLLIGCDGGQSAVREQLLGDGPPEYLGMAIWRAITPKPADWVVQHGSVSWGGPGLPTCLTQTLQGPLEGAICWQAFVPWPADRLADIGGARKAYVADGDGGLEGAEQGAGSGGSRGSVEELRTARLARALASFEGHPQCVKDLIASTDPSAITEHGQLCRDAAQCQVYARGRVALLGDAAHLSTPFLGQGCSQAVEDALELGRAVGLHGPTPAALAAYQAARLPLSGAVQAASVQLCRDFAAGKVMGAQAEIDVNIDGGFVQRTFQPLQQPAKAAEAAPL